MCAGSWPLGTTARADPKEGRIWRTVTIAPILSDTMSRKKSIVGGLLDSWRAIGGRRRETSGEVPALDERRLDDRRRDPRLILAGDEGLHLLIENTRLRVCDLSTRPTRGVCEDRS